MMPIAIPSSENFLLQLAVTAARAIVLAAGAGLALTLFRVSATSARLFTWKIVLYAALATPLLGWILPSFTISAPSVLQSLPQQFVATRSGLQNSQSPVAVRKQTSQNAAVRNARPFSGAEMNPPRPAAMQIHWEPIAAALYILIAALLFSRIAIGLLLARRLTRKSKKILDQEINSHLARRARSFGIASSPTCAESQLVNVPVTVGALNPTILLPADWRKWDKTKLYAVITHEMSHVARHDALTQHLALMYRAVFWFSPLAWWLERHLAELAEEASDEAALSCGADSNEYARALLGFFETLHATPGRVWWQGVAMAKAGQAERRLEKILAWKQRKGSVMNQKRYATVILVLAAPIILFAAAVHPAHYNLNMQHIALPPASQAAMPRATQADPEPEAAPQQDTIYPAPAPTVSEHGTAFVSPIPPIAPIAPAGAIAPISAISDQTGKSGYSYSYGYDDDERFVIVSGKTDALTMSGSMQDAHHVERLRKEIPGDFIWFQRDEKSYIIRDQATIDRARSFWAPQEELGKKQEELGKQQEALGKQQEAIGHKMEQVRVNVPDMSAELEKLKAELKALGPTATQEQLGHIQSEIGDLQSRIGDVQSQAGEQQSKIGEEMSTLGEQQGKLGEQQGELGQQQEKIAQEAVRKMKELFDEAIKNGKAQPEPDSSRAPTL
jgi:beta-lactamase regulating signal transducer with metallopeptidase domain